MCRWGDGPLVVDDPTAAIPSHRRVVDALERQEFPDGTRHTMHDSWSESANPSDKAWSEEITGTDEVRPHLFGSYGHGILGRGRKPARTEAHLHYSGYFNHAHADTLNLVLWSGGDELLSDIGYSKIGPYAHSTVAHNLVVVDRSIQRRGTAAGNLTAWDARPGSPQIIRADQGGDRVYPSATCTGVRSCWSPSATAASCSTCSRSPAASGTTGWPRAWATTRSR